MNQSDLVPIRMILQNMEFESRNESKRRDSMDESREDMTILGSGPTNEILVVP